jgi:D-amino-acid dehydrogenase
MLVEALGEIFPDWPRHAPREDWCGLRPMTPDGRPILGRSRYRNMVLNTGHGPLGWTLACGSARAVTALVDGRDPEIDLEDFALSRF